MRKIDRESEQYLDIHAMVDTNVKLALASIEDDLSLDNGKLEHDSKLESDIAPFIDSIADAITIKLATNQVNNEDKK